MNSIFLLDNQGIKKAISTLPILFYLLVNTTYGFKHISM